MIIWSEWIALFVCTVLTGLLAAALGYFMERGAGAVFLFILSGMAACFCWIGAAASFAWHTLFPSPRPVPIGVSLIGLVMAMVGVGFLAYNGISLLAQNKRAGPAVAAIWGGWCVCCLWGYTLAGLAGLVFIALPAALLFWVGLYGLAQNVLPLDEHAPLAERLLAFRALITYTLGTNYPYQVVQNRKAIERVPGNIFREFFAGPGIVMTSCDHTVVISSGIRDRQVPNPGVTFTGRFEKITDVIDLRIQLRSFDVEALTKDGIRVKVLTFVPCRIDAGSEWPELGKPFPFRKSAAFKAVQEGRLIERSQEMRDGKVVENKQKRTWEEMIQVVATQVVRRIISEYSFDDLCAPYQPQREPRKEIIAKLRQQLKDTMKDWGIQVIGGGISNLMPADDGLLQQRIDNWRAEWERRMTAEVGKGEAEYIRMVESARAQAQAEMIRTISEGLERAGPVENVSTEVIALRFIESLEKMIESPGVHQALPPATMETVAAMRHALQQAR